MEKSSETPIGFFINVMLRREEVSGPMPGNRQPPTKDHRDRASSGSDSSHVSSFLNRFPVLAGEVGRYLGILMLIALAVRLIPAAMIYGSDDMSSWIGVARWMLDKRNPYETGMLNWPPLWPALILYSARLALIYNLPVHFCIKLPPIFADVTISAALYLWFLKSDRKAREAFKMALWYALNPVAIFTVSFHGQFDSFPALFALLAIMDAVRSTARASVVLSFRSALWLGLGVLSKTWPVLLLPVCLRAPRTLWHKVVYILLTLAPAVVSVTVLYLGAPAAIQKYVLNYRSSPGWWGLTTIVNFLPSGQREPATHLFQYLFYLAIIAVLWATWRKGRLQQVACLLLLTFFVFTPGFGLQYLIWIVPIGLMTDDRRARIYTLLAGATIGLEYVFRPFDGTFCQFLVPPLEKTGRFVLDYGKQRDMILTCLIEAPLWGFLCWWWWRLLKEVCGLSEPQAGN